MRLSLLKKLMLLGSGILCGCTHNPLYDSSAGLSDPPPLVPPLRIEKRFSHTGKLFGDLSLFSNQKTCTIPPALWHGSLKTVENFPLDIADESKGIIQTQWVTLVSHPQDRFQIRVTLAPCLIPCLEAVDVSVLHQSYCNHTWQLCKPSLGLVYKIKEALLLNTRYYQARLIAPPSRNRGGLF